MQAGCMVEWMYDLRTIFEVHQGQEWELMDLCFMTCFTGTLPLSVTLAHLWFMQQILILFFQSWQPCIIHPSPPSLSLLFLLFLSLYGCTPAFDSLCVSLPLSLSPPSVSLLLAPLCWKGTVLFTQCSWWRGLCSSCYVGLNTSGILLPLSVCSRVIRVVHRVDERNLHMRWKSNKHIEQCRT